MNKSVLFVTDLKDIGGGEVFLLRFINWLQKKNKSFYVMCPDTSELCLKLKDTEYTFSYKFDSIFSFFYTIHKIFRKIKRENQRVVVCAFSSRACKFTLMSGLPVVYYAHSRRSRVTHMIFSALCRGIICVCRYLANTFYTKRLKVVPNGVDSIKFCPDSKQNNKFVLGYAGRITPAKGNEDLIYIALELRKFFKNIKIVVCGKTGFHKNLNYGEELQRRINRYGLSDNFEFKGFIEDMSAFYQNISLFLLPSKDECAPLTVLEAMASGVPVIAYDVGGVSEILEDSVQGYLIKKNDICGFVNKIKFLLNNDNLRKKMGNTARSRALNVYPETLCFESAWKSFDEFI